MRQRMVKPDFFASESLGACRPESRLAFIGLWIQADDNGRLKCQFGRLRRQIFPYDSLTDMSFAYLLAELESVGCIQAYVVGGEHYICIPNFLNYQTIQRPSKTTIPEPGSIASVTNVIPRWIAELWPAKDVDNPVDNPTLNECSMSAHSKEVKKEAITVAKSQVENEEQQYIAETQVEVKEKKSLWQRFKDSKVGRAVSLVFRIRIVIDTSALPEGRGE